MEGPPTQTAGLELRQGGEVVVDVLLIHGQVVMGVL